MTKVYEDFFRDLLSHEEDLSPYVDSLYKNEKYTEEDLNYIFGQLKSEGLITCMYGDNRAWIHSITFEGKHFFDDDKTYEKPRLLELIDQAEEIEKCFHIKRGGRGIPDFNVVYDVQEFQDWKQELQYEFQHILSKQRDEFINDAFEFLNKRFCGLSDEKDFSELKGKLKAIGRNIDKYYPGNVAEFEMREIMAEREPKIFISHSSKDEKYVTCIVALLTGMGLNHKQVFCSSLPGFGIPLDTNIFDYLREQFLNFDLHVIFVHSENYYQSAVSLNEMGAAWALRTDVTSILLPGFEYSQMVGVVNNQAIAIKLDHSEQEVKDHLNQLREKIIDEFGIEKQPDILWEQNRDSFMQGILSIQTETLQNGRQTEGEVFSEELKELLTLAADDQSGQILKTSNISSGRIIQIGDKEIFLDDSPREGALWEAAFEKAVRRGYIRQTDTKGQIFKMSADGYAIADKINEAAI